MKTEEVPSGSGNWRPAQFFLDEANRHDENAEPDDVEPVNDDTISDDLVKAIDVSSWQPLDLTDLIQIHKVDHVVVRMYLPIELPSQGISRAQVSSTKANGRTVGAYMWAYDSEDPRFSIQDAMQLVRDCGIAPKVLWIDCETYEDRPGPDLEWIQTALNECKEEGIIGGIYTGLWWLTKYLKDWSKLVETPLWIAQYDNIPTLDSVILPNGWNPQMLWGKQYTSYPIDLNVFRRDSI